MDRVPLLTKNLPKQGWTKPEIDKAEAILRAASDKKPDWVRWLDSALYWLLLLVTILGNFIISIVLVPFLLVLTGYTLYAALFFMGIVFGTMLDVIVRETEYLQKQHYVVAELLIPAIALINVYIMTAFSNKLSTLMNLGVQNSPWIVAIIYVVAFSLPHIVIRLAHQRTIA